MDSRKAKSVRYLSEGAELKDLVMAIITGGVVSMIKDSPKRLITFLGIMLIVWNLFDLTQTLEIITGKREIWMNWQGIYIIVDLLSLTYLVVNFIFPLIHHRLFKILTYYLLAWYAYYLYLDWTVDPMFQPNFTWFNWVGIFMNLSMITFAVLNEIVRNRPFLERIRW